jgi:hypothetical protein
VAASRIVKRNLASAESAVFGPIDSENAKIIDEIDRDLCLFDEHTWGHSSSSAIPDSIQSVAQYNEKSRLAYRPLALSQWLLATRVRGRLNNAAEGLYVTNTSKQAWSGWITMPASALRDDYQSVKDSATGQTTPLELRPGLAPLSRPQNPGEATIENPAQTFPDRSPNADVRFWLGELAGGEIRKLQLSLEPAAIAKPESRPENRTGFARLAESDHISENVAALVPAGYGRFRVSRRERIRPALDRPGVF